MSRRGALLIALPLIAVFGWLDYITNPEVRFVLLYLLPIVAVAWWGSERDAIVTAIIATIIATAADAPWRSTSGFPIFLWNMFTRLVIFTGGGSVVGHLRESHDRLVSIQNEHKRLYGKEAMLARTDPLTGLSNLRSFLESIQRESARAVREGSHLCVLYIDLDNFKTINDRYGHQTGDLVLQDVGRALLSSTRGGDIVARIGGDEFIILLWHATRPDAEQVAERITKKIREIAAAYPLSALDASVGLRFFERPPENADDVVQQADAAMYSEKSRRKQRNPESRPV